jgi:hypothetical protein
MMAGWTLDFPPSSKHESQCKGHPMMKSRFSFTPLIYASSLLLLLAGIDRTALTVPDEGLIVYGAQRILDGELPYKDFWSLYSPGQFWVVAALFKVFGSSLLVERLWDIIVRASIALVVYLTAALIAPKRLAVIAWLTSLGWLWVVDFYGYPLFPATLFTLVAAYCCLQFVLNGGQRMLFMAGMSTALAAAFRHDIGFYGFFAANVLLVLLYFSTVPVATDRRSRSHRNLGRNLMLLTSGLVVVGSPAVLYLVSHVPISDLWSELIVFPATVYPAVRSLPYPSFGASYHAIEALFDGGSLIIAVRELKVLRFYFHFIVLAAAAYFLARQWTIRKDVNSKGGLCLAVCYLTILTTMLFIKSLVRPQPVQLVHVVIVSTVLGVVLLHVLMRRAERIGSMIVSLSLVGMGMFPLLKVAGLGSEELIAGLDSSGGSFLRRHSARIENGNGPARSRYFQIPEDQAQAIGYIQQHVPENHKIFVGNGRHDVAVISDVMFYFLSARHSGTKFHELHPGLTTTSKVQSEIIRQLAANGVDYIVLWDGLDNAREPNKSAETTHVQLLDDFLSREFEDEARFGHYRIRRKKPLEWPIKQAAP